MMVPGNGALPAADSDALILLAYLAWLAAITADDDVCPILIAGVDAASTGELSGGDIGNTFQIAVGIDGSYQTHYDVLTGGGVKLRVEVSVIE